ncbi:YIP1 family protein [Paenibacillus baekrokdamisoli]|uniref:YIP1 family protein n=1 Tax=Paenibacillus baekrokdamisoli TaxID=1712516 RepID=UPI001C85C175|nr:YIP1 family protein [Paenibacillus baekrokdamisoli]
MTVSAKLSYKTWFVDETTGRVLNIQALYVPKGTIGYGDIDIPIQGPSDLYIGKDDQVYLADTNNNRIVVFNADGQFMRSIGDAEGKGVLNSPEGVFVTDEGVIFVADTGNKRIAVFDQEGHYERGYEKPESSLLPGDYHFVPSKIVVDKRGVMYVVVKNSYQGLLRMNEAGQFTGFFGSNKTELSLLTRFKNKILNQKQLEKEVANRPGAIENVTQADNGFLLTTSSGISKGQIKKLNAGGKDAFLNKSFVEDQLIDTAIDSDNFLYCMSGQWGEITVYDPYGNVLAFFGKLDKGASQQGVFNYPTSLAINSKKEIWVADSSLNLIQIYSRTTFGEAFLHATKLYIEGSYEESKAYWDVIVKQNGMLDLPYKGIGEVLLQEKSYGEAMQYFQESYDAEGYSESFWSVREEWIRNHFVNASFLFIVLIVLLRWMYKRYRVRMRNRVQSPALAKYLQEIKDFWFVMLHPYEGFYRLKERKISLLMLAAIILFVIGLRLLSIYGMGFIFHPYDLGRVNVLLEVCLLIVPWATWSISNYLVSTVKGGEGRFREVLQASTYALVPYVVLMTPAILLSNLVVLEERIIVDALIYVMWIWIAVNFFIMTQVIHNFDFLEAGKNVGITIVTISVIWIFTIILSALSYNLFDFIKQIYREVTIYV